MLETSEHIFFWGGVFSNFHPIGGNEDSTSEHIFVAQKAIMFKDFYTLGRIVSADTPRKAKKFGREVVGFDEKMWEAVREPAMMLALSIKFELCPEFRQALIDSGDKVLVEASPVDKIWGIGFREEDALANERNWGMNLLGKCLMKLREDKS